MVEAPKLIRVDVSVSFGLAESSRGMDKQKNDGHDDDVT